MLPKWFRRRRPGAASRPKLSVVVPVFNVETYLGECVESILAQDFPALEVVLVDDGSTDGSAALAADYAARHAGFAFVSTANQGLGAARNLGVRLSHGEFLAFVDSDDLVLPRAFCDLVATLEHSGSDFVVGSVQRLVDDEPVEPPFMRALHRQRRLGLCVDDEPEIITDCFAWNKVFRRQFWDRAALRFPTGVRYEDQVTITEAYLRADAFDVVRRPVYVWRVRADGSSITQRRHELVDLDDRLVTKRMTTELVTRLGSPQVLDSWLHRGLGGDLPLYFQHIPGCSDEYWQRLVTGVRDIFSGHPPIDKSRVLRVQHRVGGWLVTHDRRAQAEALERWLAEHPGPLPLRVEGDHVVAQLPFQADADSGIPERLFWLAEHEMHYDARLLGVRATERQVEVTGLALIRGAPSAGVGCTIEAALRSEDGARVSLDVEPRPSPEATRWVDRLPQRYDDCGFVARVDQCQLAEHRRSATSGCRWELELSVRVCDISREGRFRSKAPDVELPLTVPLSAAGTAAIVASFERGAGLVLRFE